MAVNLLLCDGCYLGATGLPAECQDGCCKSLDHQGLCLVRRGTTRCTWCGEHDRLTEVERENVRNELPTVGEEDEGLFYLHWTGERQGPYPSAREAWDDWHADLDADYYHYTRKR